MCQTQFFGSQFQLFETELQIGSIGVLFGATQRLNMPRASRELAVDAVHAIAERKRAQADVQLLQSLSGHGRDSDRIGIERCGIAEQIAFVVDP